METILPNRKTTFTLKPEWKQFAVWHDFDCGGAYHHDLVYSFDSYEEAKKLFDEEVASAHGEYDGLADTHDEKVDSSCDYYICAYLSEEDEEVFDNIDNLLDYDSIFDNTD